MEFAFQLVAAVVLVIATLLCQCAGMAILIRWARLLFESGRQQVTAVHVALVMVQFSTVMMVLHTSQILLWAASYRWLCFSSWESCFYFSAASYSTVGYGDLVLPRAWRLLGPVESMTGVLMSGLSVSCLF